MAKTAYLITNRLRSLLHKPTLVPSNYSLPRRNFGRVARIQAISTFQLVPMNCKRSLFQFVDRIENRKGVGTTRPNYSGNWNFFKPVQNATYGQPQRYVPLMLFREVIWPSLFNNLKTVTYANLLVRQFIDPQFRKKEFLEKAKCMVLKVSKLLSTGEVDLMRGLLTDDAIKELRPNLIKMTPEQRRELALEAENIFLGFIYSLDVKVDKSTNPQKREIEITCCFHSYKDKEVAGGLLSYPLRKIFQNSKKHNICNYRFIRDYTKGVKSRWMINRLNHFNAKDVPLAFKRSKLTGSD